MNMKEFYKQYEEKDIGDLSSNEKKVMRDFLSGIKPEELQTPEEHRMYIEVLQKFRMANMEDMKLTGTKFLDTLKSLLAVGEDGVYSNKQRFLYELIQNVDDCEYENNNDCRLDIQFDYRDTGKIVLTYNEKGFKPKDVFAITGIAEKSKNISSDKVEIGEKGIGFKSVFGIAEKVYIESGAFSFELYSDNDKFTVPIPKYDGFTPVNGTRLTLQMPARTVMEIYHSMAKQYMEENAVLNQNPILFLNKLTHLKMYIDKTNRYLEFHVQRKTQEQLEDNIAFEDDVIVSVDMKDRDNGRDKAESRKIVCRRYTQPIIYGEKECKSRYEENAPFVEKRHNLIALFPSVSDLDELGDYKGLLYSFLPTQVSLTVPIVLHVPFKLDGSREFVDPQNGNEWFQFTIEHLRQFLKKVYVHLASIVKQDIITYIPDRNMYFFEKNNEKISCLQKDGLKGDAICLEKMFYTADGSFENAENIAAFAIKIEDPQKVFAFLDEKRKLFIPNISVNMKRYGVQVISDVPKNLFLKGLEDETQFEGIANILDTIGKELDYAELIEKNCPIKLTKTHLIVVSQHTKIYEAFGKYAKQCISKQKVPELTFADDLSCMEEQLEKEIREDIESANLEGCFKAYLMKTNYRFHVLEEAEKNFIIAGKNGIIVAQSSPIGSLASMVEAYDQNKTFTAALHMRQASDRLNTADESMNDTEYLKLLIDVRNGLKKAFGTRMYNNYIEIINKAGADKKRFLKELLQNADDCRYPEGASPEFELKVDNDKIVVSYNECGFTKQNVRAITAIGESTKKLLLDGTDYSIGEKGVGFKSVFGIAQSVEIHSNGFDFKLTDKTPTIPDKCAALENGESKGTTLVFTMKEDAEEDIRQVLTKDKIFSLCLCLRKLKTIKIQETRICISDSETERVISLNDKEYYFEKFAYGFEINDQVANEERFSNKRQVNDGQSIFFYIPRHKSEKYFLYAGLPTEVECKVPLIVDAPFELTTSRDNVVHCRWNELVRDAVYDGILQMMDKKRTEFRIDVLKFVNFHKQIDRASYQTFSDSYLNEFKWSDKLKKARLMPVLNSEKFVSIEQENCLIIIPELIAFISEKTDITEQYSGTIIDTYKKSQYNSLLEWIGCRKSQIIEDLDCIRKAAESMITNEKFREKLYGYFRQQEIQSEIANKRLYGKVKELPIFPVKMENGINYISFSKDIYTHESKISDKKFFILATEIMEYELVERITGERVNELTQEVYDARYRNNLIAYIKSDKTAKEKAFYVLYEFKNNRDSFHRCRAELIGMIDDIPMEFLTGDYYTGNKFVKKKGLMFSGETIKKMVVSESFTELAEYLDCKDILKIHYDDIDLVLESILNEDIEDFQSGFSNYAEILKGLVNDKIISDEQVEKYNLQWCIVDDSDNDEYENFPGKPVVNLQRLKEQIHSQFQSNPNPIEEEQITVRKPKYSIDEEKRNYTNAMYPSEVNVHKYFCQMCGNRFLEKYIERNGVQKNPQYGWKQMYLSLCLECSKDYTLLRKDDTVWEPFINNIRDADIEDKETVKIQIGDKELTFTAVHLAEIQTVLELENEKN